MAGRDNGETEGVGRRAVSHSTMHAQMNDPSVIFVLSDVGLSPLAL